MSDASAIDQALMDFLWADATLRSYAPDGVFWDVAGTSVVSGAAARQFVIVSLVDAVDELIFGGRAWEDNLYAVKVVELSSKVPVSHVRAGAARLDALLDPQPPALPALTIAGYTLVDCVRDRDHARIRLTEPDDHDATIHWQHRGGHYRIQAAPV